MVAIPSKHRSLTLLAAVLLAQMLMLAVQIKRGLARTVDPGMGDFRGISFRTQRRVGIRKSARRVEPLLRAAQYSARERSAANRKRCAETDDFAVANPRGRGGPAGRNTGLQADPRAGADGGRARDCGERGNGKPNDRSGSRGTGWNPPEHGRDYAGRSGRESDRGISRHRASAAADRQRWRRGRDAGGFADARSGWRNRRADDPDEICGQRRHRQRGRKDCNQRDGQDIPSRHSGGNRGGKSNRGTRSSRFAWNLQRGWTGWKQ